MAHMYVINTRNTSISVSVCLSFWVFVTYLLQDHRTVLASIWGHDRYDTDGGPQPGLATVD